MNRGVVSSWHPTILTKISSMVRYIPHFLILLQWAAIISILAIVGSIPKIDGKHEFTVDYLRKKKWRAIIFFGAIVILYYGLIDDVILYVKLFSSDDIRGVLKELPQDDFYALLFYLNSHIIANILRSLAIAIPCVFIFEIAADKDNKIRKPSWMVLFAISVIFLLASILLIFL